MTVLQLGGTVQTESRIWALVDRLADSADHRVPLFSPIHNEDWQWSVRGSWLGGFWAALWWLRAHLGHEDGARRAEAVQQALRPQLQVDSVHRAIIFWFATGPGTCWMNHRPSHTLAYEAWAQLSSSYSVPFGCFPLGAAMGAGEGGATRINLDSLSSLAALASQVGDADALAKLRSHAYRVFDHCTVGPGMYRAEAALREDDREASVSPRGQAWAMLGLVRLAQIWPELSPRAEAACNYWWRQWHTSMPLCRVGTASHPDANAALMAGLAMSKGKALLGWHKAWDERSSAILDCALKPLPDQALPAALVAPYTTAPGTITWVQTPWTFWFVLLALSWRGGRIPMNDVFEVI